MPGSSLKRGYLLCEGHGEASGALNNLVVRLWQDLGLPHLPFQAASRVRGIHTRSSLERYCESVRARRDAGALLVLHDEDDGCPRELGPERASWIRALQLPFPTAIVLAHREYESLFLASLDSLKGEPVLDPSGTSRVGLRADAVFTGDPECVRDAKGWLSQHWSAARRYKPTVDQLPLTQRVDFALVRQAGLPWFGTLERALTFLAHNLGASAVYPPVG